MVYRINGINAPEPDEFAPECIQLPEEDTCFVWSELPEMPRLSSSKTDRSDDEDGRKGIRFLKGISRRFWSILIFFFEICILAAVIIGICLWRDYVKKSDGYKTDNIVYSSDDIVMMLVKHRDEWILPKPENGYNTCCFLDLDFDGSTELVSISYDKDTAVTQMKAYHVRNCKLEEIKIDGYDEETGTFDIGQQLALYYSADTNEMLYMSLDSKKSEDETLLSTGSFFIRENILLRRDHFSESLSGGIYGYEVFNEDGKCESIDRNEYIERQNKFFSGLTDLKLRYEWVQCGDMNTLSSRKLAALLLRSYDSYFYDTSGLGLQ